MATITVTIMVDYNDGYSRPDVYTVDWQSNFNVETAMKAAYDKYRGTSTPFTFMLVFFGQALGYFVQSLNGVAGNRVSGWALFINDAESPNGIDGSALSGGDKVMLKYLLDGDIHASLSNAKRVFYRS